MKRPCHGDRDRAFSAAQALGAVLARVSAPAGNPDVEEARALLSAAAGRRDDTVFADGIGVTGGVMEGDVVAPLRVEPAVR